MASPGGIQNAKCMVCNQSLYIWFLNPSMNNTETYVMECKPCKIFYTVVRSIDKSTTEINEVNTRLSSLEKVVASLNESNQPRPSTN
jgi:hypothetical protein